MSIGVIVFIGPRRMVGYATNSGVQLDVSYLTLCPLGHAAGRKEHALDPFLTDCGMGTLKREADFQCPECGIRFGLTDNDVWKLEKGLATQYGT